MATWRDMSRESLTAAGLAMRHECYRSSVSRAYFSAFAAVTAVLGEVGTKFAEPRLGPAHASVRTLIRKNMPGLSRQRRTRLLAAMNDLYESRLAADYRPPQTIGRDDARRSLVNAGLVAELVRVSL